MEVNGGAAKHDNVYIYQPISWVCDLHGVKNNSASIYLVRLAKLFIFVRNCESSHLVDFLSVNYNINVV